MHASFGVFACVCVCVCVKLILKKIHVVCESIFMNNKIYPQKLTV